MVTFELNDGFFSVLGSCFGETRLRINETFPKGVQVKLVLEISTQVNYQKEN
jgi:hypothetical protein